MKKLIALAVMAMLFGLVSTASAFYGGVTYMQTTADIAGVVEADMGVLTVKGGYEFNDNFAVEARAGAGITDDDVTPVISLETDYVWGVYGRVGVKLQKFNLYALLGFAGFKGTMSGPTGGSEDETDVSYGAGVEYMVTDKVGVNLEYMVWPEFDIAPGAAVEIDSFNVGVSFQF